MASMILWNARGIENKRHEKNNHLKTKNRHFHYNRNKNKQLFFSGYRTVKTKNKENNRGIAIVIKNHIEFTEITPWKINSKNIETLGVRIKYNKIEFNIVAVYRKPYGQETNKTWQELLQFNDGGLDSLIVGDFNAHNTIWNYAVTQI